MSKKDKIIQFNSIVESFLSQLSPIIGSTYFSYFKKLIKVNSVLPINYFVKYGLPYREQIINKNESYFMDEDHSEKVNNDEFKLGEILRLKGIYTKLDKKSIDNIWQIFQALVVLTEEYNEL